MTVLWPFKLSELFYSFWMYVDWEDLYFSDSIILMMRFLYQFTIDYFFLIYDFGYVSLIKILIFFVI